VAVLPKPDAGTSDSACPHPTADSCLRIVVKKPFTKVLFRVLKALYSTHFT